MLLRRTETAREEARQQEQETRERLEKRERQIADREAEMAEQDESYVDNSDGSKTTFAPRGVEKRTYEEMMEFLLTRYELTEDEAQRELQQMKQQREENIYQFGDYVERMVRLAHPELNATQQERIAIMTLTSSLENWSLERELQLRPPTSFADTMRRIKEYNGARGRRDRHSIQQVEWQPEDYCVEERFRKIEEQQDKLRDQVTNMEKSSIRGSRQY